MNKKLLRAILVGLISIIFANKVLADNKPHLSIDVYGTDKITADDIRTKYSTQLNDMLNLFLTSTVIPDESKQKAMSVIAKKIKAEIKKKGDFVYLKTSMTKSVDSQEAYFIVDAVDRKDSKRLPNFLPKPKQSLIDPDNILSLWEGYISLGYKKYFMESKKIKYKSCPAFHCMFGFEDPDYKKYKNIFFTLVPKNKDQLVTILRQDKDPDKRVNAAFLLAHIKDGNELINILVPAMRDADSKVRSGVMEELGSTLFQMENADFPVQTAIDSLDYPDQSDRYEAIKLLSEISKQQRYQKYIKEHAKSLLITDLKMESSRMHDSAYEILKAISGLKFGERDYNSWENWLNTTKV